MVLWCTLRGLQVYVVLCLMVFFFLLMNFILAIIIEGYMKVNWLLCLLYMPSVMRGTITHQPSLYVTGTMSSMTTHYDDAL